MVEVIALRCCVSRGSIVGDDTGVLFGDKSEDRLTGDEAHDPPITGTNLLVMM